MRILTCARASMVHPRDSALPRPSMLHAQATTTTPAARSTQTVSHTSGSLSTRVCSPSVCGIAARGQQHEQTTGAP
eukprot:366462-Chlamydomonas_euryale.AAC.30